MKDNRYFDFVLKEKQRRDMYEKGNCKAHYT